jgi:1-acyl-sn-glycerol-3-phosphate acyltransferase
MKTPSFEDIIKSMILVTDCRQIRYIAATATINKEWTESEVLIDDVVNGILSQYEDKPDSENKIKKFRWMKKFHWKKQKDQDYSEGEQEKHKHVKVKKRHIQAKGMQLAFDWNRIRQLRKETDLNPIRKDMDKIKDKVSQGLDKEEIDETITSLDGILRKIRNIPRHKKSIERHQKRIDELRSLKGTDAVKYLAKMYAKDIASDFNTAFFFLFKSMAAHILFKNISRNINVHTESPDTVKNINDLIKKYQVFFVPNHVSNVDQVSTCLAINSLGIPQPAIIGGENLFRGIARYVLPKMGAIKLRRFEIKKGIPFLKNKIYSEVYDGYNRRLWDLHEQPSMFYPEGTRSSDGKFVEPKIGIIERITRYCKESSRPVYYVSISLSHTIVAEDGDLEKRNSEGKKISEKDLISQLMMLDKIIKGNPDSKLHVYIGNPQAIYPDSIPEKADERFNKRIADSLMDRIKENIVITPTYFLAAGIRSKMKTDDKKEYHVTMEDLRKFYVDNHTHLIQEGYGTREGISDAVSKSFESAISTFLKKKVISHHGEGRFKIDYMGLVDQYANRIAHFPIEKQD